MSKIKEMRKRRNLLQKDVAKKLKINRSTVAKWETGCSVPRTDKLKILSTIFNCSIDDLI